MVVQEFGGPSQVIDRQVEKHVPAVGMHLCAEFLEVLIGRAVRSEDTVSVVDASQIG